MSNVVNDWTNTLGKYEADALRDSFWFLLVIASVCSVCSLLCPAMAEVDKTCELYKKSRSYSRKKSG
jgi:hypothetical protein